MKKYCLLLAAFFLFGTAGCGSSASEGSAHTASGGGGSSEAAAKSASPAISITDFAGRKIVFDTVPSKLVALGNGEMDIVYALGGKLVGRPNSPGTAAVKEASDVEQVGSTHSIDLEKIAFLEPDAVLGNNPLNMKDISAVEGAGAKMVLSSANSIDEIKKQIQLFGQMLQKERKASELIAAIDGKATALKAAQSSGKPRVLLVYGAPGTYMAALNNSLSGDILATAGGENIAADYPSLDNYPQYAQLNTEKIVKSNPQLILIMTHGNADKVKDGFIKEMQQNAAWNSLDAVKANRIEVLPADLFGTNPGTGIVKALDLMKQLLDKAK
ncbi:ABC transporter substrate-binding protein [Paenibacillus hamazuiensis]|uniref:ABC transporter substrate-binding protein n=1 Tax=Paenibacillus hamazuiensis TaxID=2936508 RepID=UPI00200F1631|nr:ABC transporter substrate-binding protein [Paenibacillus hamazuiensis]